MFNLIYICTVDLQSALFIFAFMAKIAIIVKYRASEIIFYTTGL